MSQLPVKTASLGLRNETPYPFCPGCGHGSILDQLNKALQKLDLGPREVVIVSDIGCSGLSDQYFAASAFHGLHGRSLTYAAGIKLARPDLKVIVIMGDGGTGIGGAHLINAARRNIGMTVLVMNNLNFGMTGGQHSVTTPNQARTSTTPEGNLERPLDICATAQVNGAGFVYRGTNFDKDLSDTMAAAIEAECFAILDIWDLCTAYFVPKNKASRASLGEIVQQAGLGTGLLHREEVPEYARSIREAGLSHRGQPRTQPRRFEPRFDSPLTRAFSLVAAGSAGSKLRSAVRLVGQAALLSGLWASLRDDYPITVKTGHSLAELVLSPDEIHYTGIDHPDALLIVSAEGLAKVPGYLSQMGPNQHLFALPEVAPAVRESGTDAQIHWIDPSAEGHRIGKQDLPLFAIAKTLRHLGILPGEAVVEAIRGGNPEFRDGNLATWAAAWPESFLERP